MKTKKLPYGEKARRVNELLIFNPDLSDKEIARKVGCTSSYVYGLRIKGYTAEFKSLKAEGLVQAEPVTSVRDSQAGGDHYKSKAVQPWDVYDTWPLEQRVGAYRANCTKYVMRLDDKDTPLLNAKKLLHYSQKLVEVLEEADRR